LTKPKPKIPYGRQKIGNDDIEAVVRVLNADLITTGPVTEQFENSLAKVVSTKFAASCSSGTAALHLAVRSLQIKTNDLVVVPTITFLATANAPRYVGADVLFCDVDPDTGLIDVSSFHKLCKQYGKKIVAVIPVHLAGQTPDLKSIFEIAEPRGISVIEDASHAIGSRYFDGADEIPVGSCVHSSMTTFSFHPVKNITMGEGGAVTTNDIKLDGKIKSLRNHGISKFHNNERPWDYKMDEIGYNYRTSDINCALGLSQLDKIKKFSKTREKLVSTYDKHIKKLFPVVKPIGRRKGVPAWHLYIVLIDFEKIKMSRGRLIHELEDLGVGSQVHYIPVHTQPYYKNLYGELELPGADSYYQKCLSLPIHANMTEEDVVYIVDSIKVVIEAS